MNIRDIEDTVSDKDANLTRKLLLLDRHLNTNNLSKCRDIIRDTNLDDLRASLYSLVGPASIKNKDLILNFLDGKLDSVYINKYTTLLEYLLTDVPSNNDDLAKQFVQISRKCKFVPNKRELLNVYRTLNREYPEKYPIVESLYNLLITKSVRSINGIINVTLVLPGDAFSCEYKCAFCPTQPNMPKSYLSNEDAVQRAMLVNWDPVKQVFVRLDDLRSLGHQLDKIEFRILGGTFSCFDREVTTDFIHRAIYAANIYGTSSQNPPRDILPLVDEINLNSSSKIHIAGIGIETRPDRITPDELIYLRSLGVTRIEMGVQSVHDKVLYINKRGHRVRDTIRGIQLAKNYGFKVETHIMCDLPGSDKEMDMETYRQVLSVLDGNPDLMPDYLKDYPCLDVKYTEIRAWRQSGKWQPYSDQNDGRDLVDVLVYRQSITPPWVRVNRIQRDFRPATENMDLGYDNKNIKSNLGDIVTREAINRGIHCQCIRCMEVKDQTFNPEDIVYEKLSYVDSTGTEYFIQAVVYKTTGQKHKLLLGYIRLRLTPTTSTNPLPELNGNTALIRELHVYGRVKCVNGNNAIVKSKSAQHLGIGKRLITMAENVAIQNGYTKIAVISAIGVRDYYARLGYELDGTYMTKYISPPTTYICLYAILLFLVVIYGMWRLLI
jgi:ELP3 family radical SAM enzyme/protein acetyltransferase